MFNLFTFFQFIVEIIIFRNLNYMRAESFNENQNDLISDKNIDTLFYENIQSLRNRLKISLLTSEKVLDDFSNLKFLEKTLVGCEKTCYDKYTNIFKENEKNELFNFGNLKGEIVKCADKCEEIYSRVIEHQVKGAEISYVSKWLN